MEFLADASELIRGPRERRRRAAGFAEECIGGEALGGKEAGIVVQGGDRTPSEPSVPGDPAIRVFGIPDPFLKRVKLAVDGKTAFR